YWIIRLARMQRILHRTLDRLVVLGERPVGKGGQRTENSADAFGIHNEWTHVILGIRIHLEVRNIVPNPKLRCFVPPNLLARRIPRLASWIARSAVIQDASIRRPRPRPVRIDALPSGIFRAAARHVVAIGPASRINPVSAG